MGNLNIEIEPLSNKTRNSYHYSCPAFFNRIRYYNHTFAWYFGSSVIDWKSPLNHFWGDFYEQTLNNPQGRRVYSKLPLCCTDKLSHAFWLCLLKVSLRTQTYLRLSLDSGDKRQPEIGLRSQATSRWDEEKKNKANLCKILKDW